MMGFLFGGFIGMLLMAIVNIGSERIYSKSDLDRIVQKVRAEYGDKQR